MQLSWEPFVKSIIALAMSKVQRRRRLEDSGIERLLINAEVIAREATASLQAHFSAISEPTLRPDVTVVGQLDDELKFVTWFSDRARVAKDVDVGLDLGKTVVNSIKEFFENGKEKLPFAAWAAVELLGQAIGIVRALSGKRGRPARKPLRSRRRP